MTEGKSTVVSFSEMVHIRGLCVEVAIELARATKLHGPMHSTHEAYGVLLEEVEEYWDEVRKKKPDPAAMREELIQVAAMALRAIMDTVEPRVSSTSNTINETGAA